MKTRLEMETKPAQHTPGPWIADPSTHGWMIISGSGADITSSPFDATDEDVNLIAAAPELLEALKALAEIAEPGERGYDPDHDLAYDKALAAIAKAEGNQ